jgi:aspartate aminotransferase
MSKTLGVSPDVASHAQDPGPDPPARLSRRATGLKGSEILRIAGEIRTRVARGERLCDFTVGDFDPRYFPIPERLLVSIRAALEAGETNYPPSSGVLELRHAVQRFYARELGLEYPVESILIASGSRPLIYAVYQTMCDPGDRVVYSVPSWNNNHYSHLVGGVEVPVMCRPEDRFMPTGEGLRAVLPGARLVCLNSPLNPAGTAITKAALRSVCQAILDENRAREARHERPLYLMYDQVYFMLCPTGTEHVSPPGLLPEMARFTILVDGISKAFAATGLRVGWGVGPTDVISKMSALMGHVGAWAPRPEQVATAALLDDPAAIRQFHETFKRALQSRLDRLYEGLEALKARGLPVDAVPPMGAIYVAARIHPFSRRTPEGVELKTNEDVRTFLLDAAGIAAVPFQAFGWKKDDGWFRLSVGAVSEDDIPSALSRLDAALGSLR